MKGLLVLMVSGTIGLMTSSARAEVNQAYLDYRAGSKFQDGDTPLPMYGRLPKCPGAMQLNETAKQIKFYFNHQIDADLNQCLINGSSGQSGYMDRGSVSVRNTSVNQTTSVCTAAREADGKIAITCPWEQIQLANNNKFILFSVCTREPFDFNQTPQFTLDEVRGAQGTGTCSLDTDGDYWPDSAYVTPRLLVDQHIIDNCPSTSNQNQSDADNDSIGDACEGAAASGTGTGDPAAPEDGDTDRCAEVTCTGGQICDPADGQCKDPPPPVDSDEDGVNDNEDNCASTANPGQEDDDQDGIGNLCDTPPPPAPAIGAETTHDGGGGCSLNPNGKSQFFNWAGFGLIGILLAIKLLTQKIIQK